MKKILLLAVPVLVLIVIGVMFWNKLKAPSLNITNAPLNKIFKSVSETSRSKSSSQPPATDFSSLEQSANRFQGKIDKIEGQTLTVSGRALYNQTATTSSSPIQTAPFINARVIINSATEIQRPSKIKSATASAKLSLQDLKVGQLINIVSSSNLKGVKTAEFTAKTITLLPQTDNFLIRGKIAVIQEDNVVIETPFRNYEIFLAKETSIYTGGKNNTKNLSRTDLKVGQDAIVNTKDDPSSANQITASKIELP